MQTNFNSCSILPSIQNVIAQKKNLFKYIKDTIIKFIGQQNNKKNQNTANVREVVSEIRFIVQQNYNRNF